MAGYSPLHITSPTTGLVQNRQEFLLPNDAYPTLKNAYVFRERLQRKKGYQLLGRLQRQINSLVLVPNFSPGGSGTFGYILLLGAGITASQPNASLVPGNISTITLNFTAIAQVLTDNAGTGTLTVSGAGPIVSATINYASSAILVTVSGAFNSPIEMTVGYYPNLPCMGIRTKEEASGVQDTTVFFDQKYAYKYNSGLSQFEEYIPGTSWNQNGSGIEATDFFWSTNWWVSQLTIPGTATPLFTTSNRKLFWVTNDTGLYTVNADPIRITDGVTWVDFSPPNFGQIDATNYVVQCLAMTPFRGRMVMVNTWEGSSFGTAVNRAQRIRYSAIGNPFVPYTSGTPSTGAWRDDIRGQGGFLDIPTSENIVAIGFVRDNLVIYCNRSTWQLRYTGRTIAPFQIERVNSELGTEGAFSAIQFDTSLLGIGDKGIVECDSYKSEKIDIKIPDYVFRLQNENSGPARIQGIRDFENRLAFWTVPVASEYSGNIASSQRIFPNQRLVYNYENDSWALFDDSLTALGTYQPQSSRTWLNTKVPWIRCNFPWNNQPAQIPTIVGGNQQGFIEYLDELTTNDVSLFISGIVGNNTAPTIISSPHHNLKSGTVIEISGIIGSSVNFANLNSQVFGVVVINENSLQLMKFDSSTGEFSLPQLDSSSSVYVGGGVIKIRENFSIKSKKFNFIEEGQNIQIGFIDILMSATERDQPGAITLKVYLDYDDSEASNTLPQNEINDYSAVSNPDTFFNSIIPTTQSPLSGVGGSKFWQRVFCATRANFITIEYTFSNSQLAGEEQTKQVQIDAQVLWLRKGGRMNPV